MAKKNQLDFDLHFVFYLLYLFSIVICVWSIELQGMYFSQETFL